MSQYPCDNLILGYFGNGSKAGATAALDEVGEAAFKRQLYQCMVAQALALKSDIENRRANTNAFGLITWQLNEIWPTGGWGSLEYGTTGFTKGQVLGGRWKPLHHWMAEHLFADVIATCGVQGHFGTPHCFVKNDGITAFEGDVTITALRLSDGATVPFLQQHVTLAVGPSATVWLDANASTWAALTAGGDHVLEASVVSASGALVSRHTILPAAPTSLDLAPSPHTPTAANLTARYRGP